MKTTTTMQTTTTPQFHVAPHVGGVQVRGEPESSQDFLFDLFGQVCVVGHLVLVSHLSLAFLHPFCRVSQRTARQNRRTLRLRSLCCYLRRLPGACMCFLFVCCLFILELVT